MDEVSIVGPDLAKRVFQAHGTSSSGDAIFRRKLSRSQVLPFLALALPHEVAVLAHIGGRGTAYVRHRSDREPGPCTTRSAAAMGPSRLTAASAVLVPVHRRGCAAWLPIVQRCSGSPCSRVLSVPAKAVVRPGVPNATGLRAILRKGPEDGTVYGDAHARVRRRRLSSAGPCAELRRPVRRCSTWDVPACRAGKFPPSVRVDRPSDRSVIWRDRGMSVQGWLAPPARMP